MLSLDWKASRLLKSMHNWKYCCSQFWKGETAIVSKASSSSSAKGDNQTHLIRQGELRNIEAQEYSGDSDPLQELPVLMP